MKKPGTKAFSFNCGWGSREASPEAQEMRAKIVSMLTIAGLPDVRYELGGYQDDHRNQWVLLVAIAGEA